ncbi:hypothetical protein OIU79_021622 [Salix purpurea]|uniref:Transmembrane protein n=1 Tax=Salix purpurea TaxID=77065 RepID=A0A9Q0WGY6_SALPP|nr:hypothetical protein OIU79_021622 [Salix purpurea]
MTHPQWYHVNTTGIFCRSVSPSLHLVFHRAPRLPQSCFCRRGSMNDSSTVVSREHNGHFLQICLSLSAPRLPQSCFCRRGSMNDSSTVVSREHNGHFLQICLSLSAPRLPHFLHECLVFLSIFFFLFLHYLLAVLGI